MKQFTVLFVCCMAYLIVGCAQATENVGDLASLVCKTTSGSKNHLTSLASVTGIIDYLNGLPSGHKLDSCREKYLESLQQLVHVVKTASGDVCGDEKLALLEDYHRRYISKISKHEKERKHKGKAPKLAKIFFMQYASEVSTLCQRAALELINNSRLTISDNMLASMDTMRKLTDDLGLTDLSKGFDGIQMFWNIVESLDLKKNEKFAKYLVASGDKRLNIQMRDAEGSSELQGYCRHQMKPVYARSLLPVLRLIDMGYYPRAGDLLKSEGLVKDLLYATQICETILPVGIYSNENLNTNEVIALTEAEASLMPQHEPLDSTESPQSSLEETHSSLDANELNFGNTPSADVKASVDYRGNIISRMLKRMVKQLKNLKSVFKGFKLFRKDHGQKLLEVDEDHLEEMAEKSLQISERVETGLVRKKREPITIAVAIIMSCVVTFILIQMIKFYRKKAQEKKARLAAAAAAAATASSLST